VNAPSPARRCRLILLSLLAGCLVSLFALAVPALAEQSDFSALFDPATAATSAALRLHIVYRDPANPDGKPSPIRHLVINAPSGTVINVGTVPRCDASDQQIQAEGPSACPPNSQVGNGTLTALTGFGPPIDPFTANVTIFNDGRGWIEVVQEQQSGATVADDRIQANGDTLTGNPPATPGGPPDGQTAVRTIDFAFPASTGYITTPPSCPRDGSWTWTAAFTFADGSTQNVQSVSACQPASSGARHSNPSSPSPPDHTPRLRLTASPSRVRTGWHNIRFLVGSPASRCRRGATIRFAGRRVRTNSHGRAAIRARLTRPGNHRAAVTKRGCNAATTIVVAVRHARSHHASDSRPAND
jgi:hypothetical protein